MRPVLLVSLLSLSQRVLTAYQTRSEAEWVTLSLSSQAALVSTRAPVCAHSRLAVGSAPRQQRPWPVPAGNLRGSLYSLCAATTFLRRCCGLGTLTARVPAGDPRCRDDQAEGGGGCCALCALSFFSPASVRGVARARRSRRYLTLRRMSRTDSAEIEHLRRQQRQGVRIARGALEQARDDLNTSVRHEPMSSSNLRLG